MINTKYATTAASVVLLVGLVLILWRESQRPVPNPLTPAISGETEYCLTCHADLPQISPSHPVETFGCVLCHGGERLALDADLAHSTMRGGANPADLAVAEVSCGGTNCHSGAAASHRDHIPRVKTSLQATYAGAIAQMRYAFGSQTDAYPRQGIYAVESEQPARPPAVTHLDAFDGQAESSPSLRKFAENCLTCHLSAKPTEGAEYARFSGCAACHTPLVGSDPDQDVHKLTLAIPYSQCNTCHNRGNYSMVDIQFHPRQDAPADRLHDYYQPIAQFTRCEWELDCVDCHTRTEAMGDGNIYGRMKDIQYIQCRTCHGTLQEQPAIRTITDAEDFALYKAFLNPVIDLKIGDTIVVTAKGEDMWAMRGLPDGKYELFSKASGKRYIVPLVMDSGCQQSEAAQDSASCHACHAVER
jgi:hypothetical protein